MSKRIVICCDGTGNDFDDIEENSNVAKLYRCLIESDEQKTYYYPGVGTAGAPTRRAPVVRLLYQLLGLAFGKGLLPNVADAYRYLIKTYAPGDQIFVFGFSRGAYTARVLCSVLHACGLLHTGNDKLIPEILRMYKKRAREAYRAKRGLLSTEASGAHPSKVQTVRVRFCGIWDTVSSYGWIYNQVRLPVDRNPIIDIGRHAISIHERRCFYQQSLWGEPYERQDLNEVWFCGVHSDVGGSYRESESGLSKIAFEWMLVEAMNAGLLLDPSRVELILGRRYEAKATQTLPRYCVPDENARCHNSLYGPWWLLEFLPHHDPQNDGTIYLPRGRRRKLPDRARLHQSVLTSQWRPRSLPHLYEIEPWFRYSAIQTETRTPAFSDQR